MPEKTVSVVGMQFHPPAKAMMGYLPSETDITLVPDPSNPYDGNAIQIHVKPTAVPESERDSFNSNLAGFGIEVEEFYQRPSIFLGFIPRKENEDLANAFRWTGKNEDGSYKLKYKASLAFDINGWPKAEITWEQRTLTMEDIGLEEEDEEDMGLD